MLRVERLTVTIAGKCVCRDLSLQVRAGQRWAVLGPNGVGKTTLLHTLAGLRAAAAGAIQLGEQALEHWPPRLLARWRGLLLQHYEDPFSSTVLDTALIGRHPYLGRWEWESSADAACARAALATVDIGELAQRTVSTLSGGERRRLAIAALLVQDPRLMLLDEPTNHLDLRHQLQTLALFTELAQRQGKALVMVTHDLINALQQCDHALLLFGEGETLAGPSELVVTEENLSRLYGCALRRARGPSGEVWLPAARQV